VIRCSACSFVNLPGTDVCEECKTPLAANPKDDAELAKRALTDPIKKAGLRNPVVVEPKTSAKQVLSRLKEANTGCAIIVRGNEFLGIFTERDVLQRLAKPGIDLDEVEIENVMTPTQQILAENEPVAKALNLMAMGNYRHVPIRLDKGTYTVFSVLDALRYFF
jgi:CBS domain-containing protein